MNFNLINKDNIYLIYWYLIVKIISLISIIIILPIIFNQNYFYANDFYNVYVKCDFTSPNYLFSIITCFLKINNLTDFQALFLSGVLSFLKDILFIFVAINFLRKKIIIMFILLLAVHPYLNLYYLKFTPDLVNNFMISLYLFLIIKKIHIGKGIGLIFLLGTMMRNSLVVFFISHYLIDTYKKIFEEKKIVKNKYIIFENTIFIILLSFSFLFVMSDYGLDYLSSNKTYDLNINYFLNKIDTGILFLDYLFSGILNFLSHLILLTGFREQSYTEFLYFFSNENEYLSYYLILGVLFFSFHLIGLYYFLKKFLNSNIYIVNFLILLIPHIFYVAHLRYFMPLIPISIFGVCLLLQNYLNQNKNEK